MFKVVKIARLCNMKTLNVILGLFLALLMVPAVFAAGEVNVGKCTDTTGKNCKLLITDVDVKVDSKSDKNMEYGDAISEEAKPGSKVKFSIELFNNFTDAEDVEIEDAQVTITIEGIDDGDDIEEESSSFDIKADDNDNVDIEFEIPLEVDEDDFDVTINVEGDTDKNGSQESEMTLTLEVQKEKNEVRFLSNALAPSEVKCARNVQLSTSVINTGSDQQDDAILEVSNEELGIALNEAFELSEDAFEDDSKFSKAFTIKVSEDTDEGTYPIVSKVTYNGGRNSKTETADLTVTQCEIAAKDEDEDAATKEDEESKDDTVVVVQPPQNDQGNLVTAGAVTAPQLPTEEKSIFESQSFLVALVVGEVLLVLIAILLVVAVAKKRRE